MASNFNIQNLHLLTVQVSDYPIFLASSISNFISGSRKFPHFRVSSITTYSPLSKLHSRKLDALPLSSEARIEQSFAVSYLINSCGFPPELAVSRAKYVKSDNTEQLDTVLAFLEEYGFSKTQVSHIIAKHPRLLLCNPEKTLLPKLEFLGSLGLSNEEVTHVISAAPVILRINLENVVIPCYNLLRKLLDSDDKTINVIKRYPKVLAHKPEVDVIQILQEAGVPPENIVVSMTWKHGGYMRTINDFRKIVEEVRGMGFDPCRMNFLWAIRSKRSMRKSAWESKVQGLKNYGWSDLEVVGAFEKNPKFIMASKEKISGVMDFFIHQMGLKAATIANMPTIISMSLKKRIVPRCSIYQVLLEKGLVKEEQKLSIATLMAYSEKEFLRRVIKPHENEAPEILTSFQEMSGL